MGDSTLGATTLGPLYSWPSPEPRLYVPWGCGGGTSPYGTTGSPNSPGHSGWFGWPELSSAALGFPSSHHRWNFRAKAQYISLPF